MPIIAQGQSGEIKIRFIGNCGRHITDGLSNLYIDFPYKSGAYNTMEYDLNELDRVKKNPIFVFTHRHLDHYYGRIVKDLARKLNGQIYTPRNVKDLVKLNEDLSNFNIKAFKTKHKFSFKHYSYLIIWHDKKIFISGDTEHSETISSLKDIDWAFLPVWLIMDAIKKDVNLEEIVENIAVYHIRHKDNITTKSTNIKLLDKQGIVITIQ